TKTFHRGDALSFKTRLIKVASMKTNFRAEIAHRLQLRWINFFGGSVNNDASVEELPGVSDRLTMVSGRSRDDRLVSTSVPLLAHEIHTATHLERAHGLQVF